MMILQAFGFVCKGHNYDDATNDRAAGPRATPTGLWAVHDAAASAAQALSGRLWHCPQICRFVSPAGGCFAARHGQAVTLHKAQY